MKLKRLQISLGSLFLATLTFGVGLIVGLRFNLSREAVRVKHDQDLEAFKVLVDQHWLQCNQNHLLKDRIADLEEEIERLKDERAD